MNERFGVILLLLEQLMLHSFIRLSGSRSAAAAYHLITGRSSIQTKQDVHLFQLDKLYGVFPALAKREFEQKTDEMLKEGLIELVAGERESVIAGQSASERLQSFPAEPFLYFDGSKYGKRAETFAARLLLLIQTVSNMAGRNNRFIAITEKRETTAWVRQYYLTIRGNEKAFLEQLHKELLFVMERFSEDEAAIFTARLSGYNHYGKSHEQLAGQYGMSRTDMHLLLTGLHHEALRVISGNETDFPILSACGASEEKGTKLAGSTGVTRNMLENGMNIHEIASTRSLKVNTIHDHIVEIALRDRNFDMTPYLSKTRESKIQEVVLQSKTGKLRDIKESLDDDTDYFQIRLAIARLQQKSR